MIFSDVKWISGTRCMNKSSVIMKVTLLLLAAGCLVLVEPTKMEFWQFDGSVLHRNEQMQVIAKAEELAQVTSADLDGDGKDECIRIDEGTAQITDCSGSAFWQSSKDWQVKQAFLADLNRDGRLEAALLVWRTFDTWPIDRFVPSGGRIKDFHDRRGMSCHLILIGWDGAEYKEVWAGSALIRPVEQLAAIDLDGDGWQELAALQGEYDSPVPGGSLTVWRWDGFGFMLVDEINERFTSLRVLGNSSGTWLAVQK
jgi:hypothetical protein